MQNVSNEPREFLISDLFDIKRGNSKYTTEYILENPGEYPVYSGSTENNGEIGKINTYDYDGEFLTWTTDGYAGHIFYRNGKFNMNSHCGLLIPKTHNNIKYIKYALNNVARLYVNNDSAIPNLGKDVISNISITLPPIHKQNSIVNILEQLEENNNNLIDILENQVILISNQYQYYFSKIIKLLIQN
ncbi:restriction endonuclease subunit S [Mesomycoplasma bovoculi]|uniref:Type I site-specific DNA methyltransferase specificity subunit n=1 Tax=Mesomycoplasma bovoculi M165/69 TaxID=743966 RepID=W5USL7_9BACT|nr:restriction endonuclease subunit S [Mesomycoplasma bovoculi]AHH45209.1 type I site-specific DNA methyltransferase specificity subunit [Mesomycoplasma bovoculi M165/69]